MPKEDLTGRTFGSLTYLKDQLSSTGGRRAIFQCVCGKRHESLVQHVKAGRTHNCGCKRKEMGAATGLKRRKKIPRGTPEYYAWTGMKQRCYNEKSRWWCRYGGRGIIVCDRWLNSYETFYADMGQRPGHQYSLDRVNVDGPYSPDNCRWATAIQQQNNKSSNCFVEWMGETKTLAQWARHLGLKPVTVKARFYKGWALRDVFAPKLFKEYEHARYARAISLPTK